jgi:uncharacterized protein (TIGR02246 family)
MPARAAVGSGATRAFEEIPMRHPLRPLAPVLLALVAPALVRADADADRAEVARLDTAYQAAVRANDAEAMARILHPEMILVTGTGRVVAREELLDAARQELAGYSHQEEIPGTQVVRLYGDDTAVVTARLWIAYVPKGGGDPADYQLWFSDTYVRTPAGWKYAFGQAAQRLAPGS